MTDKKPTDKDIIKALDICSKSTNGCSHSKYTCEDCYLNGQPMCSSVLLQDAIDLHTRQQSKIDDLMERTAVTTLIDDAVIYTPTLEDYNKFKKEIKSEAVKKFAQKVIEKVEKARQKYQRLCAEQGDKEDEAMNIHFRGMINIVKEMVCEKNEV